MRKITIVFSPEYKQLTYFDECFCIGDSPEQIKAESIKEVMAKYCHGIRYGSDDEIIHNQTQTTVCVNGANPRDLALVLTKLNEKLFLGFAFHITSIKYDYRIVNVGKNQQVEELYSTIKED